MVSLLVRGLVTARSDEPGPFLLLATSKEYKGFPSPPLPFPSLPSTALQGGGFLCPESSEVLVLESLLWGDGVVGIGTGVERAAHKQRG